VPFPDEVEEDNPELEERAAAISNAAVLESVVVTSPIGEAWKVYPELDWCERQVPKNRESMKLTQVRRQE